MCNKDLIEERIIAFLNKEIGSDFKNLHRAAVLVDNYKTSIEHLKKNLNHKTETDVTSIQSALHSQHKVNDSMGFQKEKLAKFDSLLSPKIEKTNAALTYVIKDLGKVRQLQQLSHYLKIVQDIQEISQCLNNAVNGRDEAKMVNIYLTLFEDKDCENSVIGRLSNIESHYLKLFAMETASYWHKILSEKFVREMESILKSMRWGCKENNSLNCSSSGENIAKAKLLAEYLYLIKCPIEEDEPLEVITPSIICQPISTVTKLLLAPYQIRFQYHFTGVRQTNRLDKPEWYFTQILNWIKEAHIFVGKTFQQSAIKAGILDYNIRLEFIRGLVQMIIEKLTVDIEAIGRDEQLFAHLLDETLAFEAELRGNFGYPSSFPSVICVITQPVYLLKWISLEERFCAEKMDLILHGDDPWTIIDPTFYDKDLKIPKCADQFIRLLEAIKERYSTLIQPGQQLQFLSLQLELIENFRQRLVQLFSSGEVGIESILNAINYLALVLNEWGEHVHYLHLHAALVGRNSNEIHSVFDQPVSELEHWTKKLVESLATKAVNEIKAKSMAYRHDCWASIPDQNCKEPFILSTSAGEMFQVMVTTLHNMERDLSLSIFNLTLRLVANLIDEFLYYSLVMNNKFTPAGAAQFNFDMTRNLFPLFGQYCRRPDLLFKKIHDSNKLLNAARGTALLLHEELKTEKNIEQKMNALKELGIVNFKYQTCINILERRTDLKVL
ncbi:RINT1-like protein isoform X1 [Zeugodacus cucurbitae]|uniref:RINT1-like protein n=1 Tax=Zeugodacus cucurbitae TaxID=28588 RepID=A0A0A1WXP2_ZEUCU|nr:RINT1-like protein isoform X1 [Zeugodacus cucurbitae]XP_054084433.1 RINT1-like protein isoform X1 [Zeugodacus cucurbitae]XP_054084434.1 RINT1-like protein isoform X1 [Zeugodacus cucurbitae]XP_054084435.1 RINT1-like protein isoform X1 [Zeugodacus cucurbitae]XP_054084436.1 RINT1-like protein isoform X1 [Zeugodacus cucurbitae]